MLEAHGEAVTVIDTCLKQRWGKGGRDSSRFSSSSIVNHLPEPIYGSDRKESTCSARDKGDPGSIPRSGRSPGAGKWQPSLVFLPGDPLDRGAWWATVHRVTKSWT